MSDAVQAAADRVARRDPGDLRRRIDFLRARCREGSHTLSRPIDLDPRWADPLAEQLGLMEKGAPLCSYALLVRDCSICDHHEKRMNIWWKENDPAPTPFEPGDVVTAGDGENCVVQPRDPDLVLLVWC